MLPILLQNLIKRNKNKAIPSSEKEVKSQGDKFATFVLWIIFIMVLVGLILK